MLEGHSETVWGAIAGGALTLSRRISLAPHLRLTFAVNNMWNSHALTDNAGTLGAGSESGQRSTAFELHDLGGGGFPESRKVSRNTCPGDFAVRCIHATVRGVDVIGGAPEVRSSAVGST